MARQYVLATIDYGNGERYDALYADGELIATPSDGKFTGFEVLDAIAMSNIAVSAKYVEVDRDFDERVVANTGWPESLADVETVDA